MESQVKNGRRRKNKRALRVRKKLKTHGKRVRMSIFKSNRNIYVQLIDDENSKTIASASSMEKAFQSKPHRRNKEIAKELGQLIATRAKEKQIDEVLFDRGPYKYHGILASLAESARESGLKL